jgi:hypothetical protein
MSEPRPILLIQPPLKGAGLGACVLTVLNYLRYCEREGLTPVVHIDGSCGTEFLDPAYGDNVWEQYFEPVGPYSSADLQRILRDPARSEIGLVVRPGDDSLPPRIKVDPDSIFSWTFGHWRTQPPKDLTAWFAEQRRKGRDSIRRFVRVKPHILAKVDGFWDRYLRGHQVLGVHIRGTDLRYAPPVSPAEYFEPIERYLAEHSSARLFLATDQIQYLEVMRKRFGPIVRSYDCLRSATSTAPFNLKVASPYQKGEEVLIDILLLSRCAFLIRGASNIPELAIYFSDALESRDLSLEKRFVFGQDYLDGWSSLATRPAWEIMKKTSLEEIPKHTASQALAQRVGYGLRRVWARVVTLRRRIRRRFGLGRRAGMGKCTGRGGY